MSNKAHLSEQRDRLFGDVGEALEGLLGEEIGESQIRQIPVGTLLPRADQPRTSFAERPISELAASIEEQGVLQPLIVRPKQGRGPEQYEIVAGERRWRAGQLVGLETLPCIVREFSDADAQIVSLIENLHREDLSALERGQALRAIKDRLNVSWAQLAKRVGLTRRSVLRLAGLVELPDHIQDTFAAHTITEKHGRALKRLKADPERQLQLAKAVTQHDLSGDETINLTKLMEEHPRRKMNRLVQEMRAARRSGDSAGVIMKTTMQFLRALRETNPEEIEPRTRKELAKALDNLENLIATFRNRLRAE